MVDLDEPLNDYVSFLRDEHQRNVSEYFENMVDVAGIDEHENIKTVAELRDLELGVSKGSSKRAWWGYGRALVILLSGLAIYLGFIGTGVKRLWFIPALGLIALLFAKINPEISKLNSALDDLKAARDEKSAEAWAQLEPLNSQHTWEAAARLFQKTLPQVKLDKYFSNLRLADLIRTYNLTSSFTDGRSILFSQSGALSNNPFVVTKYLHHWIGSRTYTGSMTIYWTETVKDANGNYQTVQRSQVLTASVVKPYPEYTPQAAIIYGHEAAPNLSFSRSPSNLSGLDEGLLNNWRKHKSFKQVEKKARKDIKSGNGQLTVMSNKEFETLFKAMDRDNEIEFRLLFTPLAQQEMVKLLNDKAVGYGDNFAFTKQGMINVIETGHLGKTDFQPNPAMFHTLSISHARSFFNEFHNEFFRSLYFGLAPLLTVPLYTESRTIPELKVNTGKHESSYWEHEAMANYIGQDSFKHPNSITQNLLKVSNISTDGANHVVSVTAYGYEGFPRIDYVPVAGGDGNVHAVPVEWIEYIGVSRESKMAIGAIRSHDFEADDATNRKLEEDWETFASSNGLSSSDTYMRGPLIASILGL
jgi:hypothetical protein